MHRRKTDEPQRARGEMGLLRFDESDDGRHLPDDSLDVGEATVARTSRVVKIT